MAYVDAPRFWISLSSKTLDTAVKEILQRNGRDKSILRSTLLPTTHESSGTCNVRQWGVALTERILYPVSSSVSGEN